MSAVGNSKSLLGWLAIPPVLLAFVLAGLAVSTEPKEEFEERTRSESRQDQIDDQSQSREPMQDGSDSGSDGNSSGNNSSGGNSSSGSDGSQGNGSGRSADGTRQPIIIGTDNGEIVIEFDNNGRPTRAVAGESVASDRVFTPDPDGGYVGFRIIDGRLEPVEVGDLNDGDYWLLTSDDTLDIVRPDGTEFRLRVDADNQFSASKSTPTGQTVDLGLDPGKIVIQTRAEFEDIFVGEPGDSAAEAFAVDPATEPIGIALGTGQITIGLQPDGNLTATADNPTVASDFDDRSAIRVDENGNFEVIPLDEIGPDDTVLVPRDNGFDLVRPDGSRVEFRPDGENDGVTATEVSVDGERRELEPNPDGTVTLDDGRTVGPIDFAEDGGALERLLDQTSDLPWPWVFAGIALLAALSIGTAVHLHRNRPKDEFDFGQFAVDAVPEDQMEKFLTAIGNEPDPTRAIRLAFYTVERGMAGLPPRRADETPFEWHGRVASTNPQLAAPLGPICDLFALARFAPNEATAADRDLMIEHLQELNHVAHNYRQRPATAGV